MLFLFCGVIIGLVMGLTGAGGALIAIPLCVHILGMSLKEASVYSLVAVVVASALNFFSQRKLTEYKTALVIILSSTLGSFVAVPFKALVSSFVIALLLSGISFYALYSVWFPSSKKIDSDPKKINVLISGLIGILLGILTTFTGLGGGVLMLPLFMSIYHYSSAQAVATSLFVVSLSSLASLVFQVRSGATFVINFELLWLVSGMLVSVFLLKRLVTRLSDQTLLRLRQVVFSFVVALAIASIF